MKQKRKRINLIIFISLSLILAVFLLSGTSACFMGSDSGTDKLDKIDVEEGNNIPGDIDEEIVDVVKGEDLTDYDNVEIGAEIKGAIPGFLCTNKDNIITIEVKNTSDFTWRNDSKYPVKVAYHYYGQDVDASDYDGSTRSVFDKYIEPGETAKIDVLINDIKEPGNYVLQIDLVLEGKYWFSSKGMEMLESPVFFAECAE